MELSQFCDFHTDSVMLDLRKLETEDLERRRGQSQGIGEFDLAYVSLFDQYGKYDDKEDYNALIHRAVKSITEGARFHVVRNREDLEHPGPKALLHIEGLNVVTSSEDLGRIDELWDMGVRSMGPIYSPENLLGGGNAVDENIGLQLLGRDAIERILSVGMILDVAHCNQKTMEGVLDLDTPVGRLHYTHGALLNDRNADFVNHQRALMVEHAERIIGKGGLIGLSPTRYFFRDIEHVGDQILQLGQDNDFRSVCIGTDFGGLPSADHLLPEIGNYRELVDNLGDRLTDQRGINEAELVRIFRDNILRITEAALPEAEAA